MYVHRPKEAEETTAGARTEILMASFIIYRLGLDNVHVSSVLPFHWSLICSINMNHHAVLIDVECMYTLSQSQK